MQAAGLDTGQVSAESLERASWTHLTHSSVTSTAWRRSIPTGFRRTGLSGAKKAGGSCTEAGAAAWSSDGTKLAYAAQCGGGCALRRWRRADSNPRPPACKAGALPTELRPRGLHHRCGSSPSGVKWTGPRTASGSGYGVGVGGGVGDGVTPGSGCSIIPSSGAASRHVRAQLPPVKLESTDQKYEVRFGPIETSLQRDRHRGGPRAVLVGPERGDLDLAAAPPEPEQRGDQPPAVRSDDGDVVGGGVAPRVELHDEVPAIPDRADGPRRERRPSASSARPRDRTPPAPGPASRPCRSDRPGRCGPPERAARARSP